MVTTELGLLTCRSVEDVRHGRMIVCLGTCGEKMKDRFISISAYDPEKPVQIITCFDKVEDALKDFNSSDNNEWVLTYLDTKDFQGLHRLDASYLMTLPLN